ncbi:hypothetical protein FHS59_002251 [Algoriphagus iocasae]|uniref:Uncharacterized protein n=1 Tax=Algoriphagus iocasae TaxID=1836499 RepID=A0A841MIC0_9BACT|nr:hypothetical protein [Algoriphagus iocasae]MBB6326623.1 hypothetical protein [Algoriphagus iocasae]
MKIVNHTFDFQISMENTGEKEGFPLTEKVKTVGLREFLFGIV